MATYAPDLMTVPTRDRTLATVSRANAALMGGGRAPDYEVIPTATGGRFVKKINAAVKDVAYPIAYIVGF